jgi:hypothetical protein
MLLQDFPYKVIHISGKKNIVTDILSRYPNPDLTNEGISDESMDILLNEIIMIGESDLDYEPILKYIYIHISTISNEDIP